MIGMGFSDKPVAYEYSVHDHADMHEALLPHLGVDSCHVLAHDLGDSVGQELLARYEFGDNAYGAPVIESITWLNGGLFNEAYTPAADAEADVANTVGGHDESLAGQPGVAARHGPHAQRDVRAQHQADAAACSSSSTRSWTTTTARG